MSTSIYQKYRTALKERRPRSLRLDNNKSSAIASTIASNNASTTSSSKYESDPGLISEQTGIKYGSGKYSSGNKQIYQYYVKNSKQMNNGGERSNSTGKLRDKDVDEEAVVVTPRTSSASSTASYNRTLPKRYMDKKKFNTNNLYVEPQSLSLSSSSSYLKRNNEKREKIRSNKSINQYLQNHSCDSRDTDTVVENYDSSDYDAMSLSTAAPPSKSSVTSLSTTAASTKNYYNKKKPYNNKSNNKQDEEDKVQSLLQTLRNTEAELRSTKSLINNATNTIQTLEEELYVTKENEDKLNDECKSNSEALHNAINKLATLNKINNDLTNKINRLNEEKSVSKSLYESNINQLEGIIYEKEEDCDNIQHNLQSANEKLLVTKNPSKNCMKN